MQSLFSLSKLRVYSGKFFVKWYNYIVAFVWAIILISWGVRMLDYASVSEMLLFGFCMFAPTILVSYILSNKIVLAVIKGGVKWKYIFLFILSMSFLSTLYVCLYRIFIHFVRADFMERIFLTDSLFKEFFMQLSSAIISIMLMCGLRFLYEHIKLSTIHSETQLKLLQIKVNPYFMLSILEHINVIMQKDIDMASQLLIRYSEMLRYQLYEGVRGTVPLETEIQFLKDIVDMEKMRLDRKINIDCEWDIDNNKLKIQPLILITFVENAIKYAQESPQEDKYVNIRIKQEDDLIFLDIENSKAEKQGEKEIGLGMELQNVRDRLNILYNDKYTLSVEEKDSVFKTKLKIIL